MAELDLDAVKARLAAWQEEPCTGGYPGMPVWPGAHGGCWFCDQKIADATEDPIEAFSRPMIVCPECGNKRCPKARWHRNECTSSNAAKQVCDYPVPFTPADVAALVAEVERLRVRVDEFEGLDDALIRLRTQLAEKDRELALLRVMKAPGADAWDAGWQDAHADHNDNPYRREPQP